MSWCGHAIRTFACTAFRCCCHIGVLFLSADAVTAAGSGVAGGMRVFGNSVPSRFPAGCLDSLAELLTLFALRFLACH
jgi:hypothetical protein